MMLKKSNQQQALKALWCIVSGSGIYLINDALPFGTADELIIRSEHAVQLGIYNGFPVMWVNEADVDRELALNITTRLLAVSRATFFAYE